MTRNVYVFCEGFHDRDLLAGWFEHVRGWKDPTNGGARTPDPSFAAEKRTKGKFVFAHPRCRVCLVPTGGRERLRAEVRASLTEVRSLQSLGYSGLVVIADGDHRPGETVDPVGDLVREAIRQSGHEQAMGPPWELPRLRVDVVSMQTGVLASLEGLPNKECLERVVVAAFARAYPQRYAGLLHWLQHRPEATGSDAKTANWSIMASWFADHGCTDYLRRAIWQDPKLRAELEQLLPSTRLPKVVAALEAG